MLRTRMRISTGISIGVPFTGGGGLVFIVDVQQVGW